MSDAAAALAEVATRLRIHSVESTSKAGSGHPTSCASMAELMAVAFFESMRYHVADPRNINNDRFILSKGHAAPILYAAWAEAGLFPQSDLLKLRELTCDLEGHPTPRLPFVDVATGSLGQGLSAACGIAYAMKNLEKSSAKTYCLMGDGESAEGSVWEAAAFASHYGLDNLIVMIDVNRLGQSEPTMYQHNLSVYETRWAGFGWRAIVIDGHDIVAVREAFAEARAVQRQPTAIIAKTFKGRDFPGIEDKENWHGKALGDKTEAVLTHLKAKLSGIATPKPATPTSTLPAVPTTAEKPIVLPTPAYKLGDMIATRVAYGSALAALGKADERVVGLDGDTKNSTYSEKIKAVAPNRYVECFIAEQNLIGVAVGMGTRGLIPFASTFACFLSRGYDQVRMAAISQANVKLVGSHAGVSIGEDGPSQMALEDLAIFRAIPNATVFYPSDAVSCERAVELAANHKGIVFIRTSRPTTPVVYANDEPFAIGQAKIVKQGPADQLVVVACGITFAESLKAVDELAKLGIGVTLIDPFTLKPLDRATILSALEKVAVINGSKHIVTVEDHYPEGGIGDAVAGELADVPNLMVHKIAVREIPRSGKPDELLAHFGINSTAIIAKVRALLGR